MDFARYDWLAAVEFRLGVWLSRLAHLIICNSHAGLAHHAKHGYPRDRMVVIPNGIDIERFKPDHQARQALRAEWSVDADERLIGLVARLDPMKDHENFLRAAAKVAEVRREAKFVCVGAGAHAYAAALRQLGDALGLHERLLWVGERIDVPRIYNALDISVSSSVSGEGFPNAVAESMATGICCVVTDVGDSAKLVGNSGFVCAPNDSPALAHAILDALDALRADSTAVRQRICSEFTSSALIERTIPYLVHLLRDSAPCPANP